VNHALRLRAKRLASVTRFQPFDTSTAEGRSKERYRRIALTLTSGFFARVLATGVNVLMIPIILTYLGKDQFGLWSAITSTVVWLSVFDFGISTGLVNSLAEAHGRDDTEAAGRYVSTAGIILTLIATGIAGALLLAAPHIAWDAVFAAKGAVPEDVVRLGTMAAVGAFLLGMPLSIVTQIYAAYQKAFVSNLFAGLGALTALIAVWGAIRLRASLPALIFAFSAAPLIMTLANGLITRGQMPWLRISWSLFSVPALRRLGRTSVPLFLLQVGALMVNQSQLFILAHTTGLSTVANYTVILRIMQISASLVLLTTGAFLPPYREAFERGDHAWVTASFRRMLLVRMGLTSFFAFTLVGLGNDLVRLWLRRSDIHFGLDIWSALAILLLSSTWVTAHTDLLTILDRIWIQVILVMFNGIATIVLTLVLSQVLGILGVIAAVGVVTVFGWTWLLPLISRSVLKSAAEKDLGWT
jgi:O-antigen/teichoic acid export membrane protein